jgi:hypothetical protein
VNVQDLRAAVKALLEFELSARLQAADAIGTMEAVAEAMSSCIVRIKMEESNGLATRMRLHHIARLNRTGLRGATTTLAGQTHGVIIAKLRI